MQLIEQERSEAEILLQRSVSHPHDAALLADPRLFLRKWIAEVTHRRPAYITSVPPTTSAPRLPHQCPADHTIAALTTRRPAYHTNAPPTTPVPRPPNQHPAYRTSSTPTSASDAKLCRSIESVLGWSAGLASLILVAISAGFQHWICLCSVAKLASGYLYSRALWAC